MQGGHVSSVGDELDVVLVCLLLVVVHRLLVPLADPVTGFGSLKEELDHCDLVVAFAQVDVEVQHASKVEVVFIVAAQPVDKACVALVLVCCELSVNLGVSANGTGVKATECVEGPVELSEVCEESDERHELLVDLEEARRRIHEAEEVVAEVAAEEADDVGLRVVSEVRNDVFEPAALPPFALLRILLKSEVVPVDAPGVDAFEGHSREEPGVVFRES